MTNFTTTRPTGRPAWPTILLAGIEGSGKSWTAAAASGLELFGRTFFLEVGEQMADEYGAIPGADYEIILHDGTERQIIQAAQWAAEQETDGKPNLLIIDSMTEVWQVMQDEQQRIANERAAKKGRANTVEAPITMDQWNVAKDHFNDVVMAARKFPGPVIMTARLDNVSVVEGGQPTGEKIWKVRSEKNLVYATTVIMQAREVRKWMMTKVASRELQMPTEGFLAWPDFTIEELLIRLGLDVDADVAESTFVRPSANRDAAAEDQESDDQPTPSPAEVNTGQLPENLPEVIAQLEAELNRDELFRLYKIAENMARRNVPRARTHMARIETAGKRVARRLEAGEQAPKADQPSSADQEQPPKETSEPSDDSPSSSDPSTAESTPERGTDISGQPGADTDEEPPVNDATSDATDSSDDTHPPTPDSETSASPEQVDEQGAPQTDDLVQPNTPTTPQDSDASTGTPDTENGDSEMPEFAPNGTNKDSGQPVDPPQSRRESKLRAATIKIMEVEHGSREKANDYVYSQLGLEIDETSTQRLGALSAASSGTKS